MICQINIVFHGKWEELWKIAKDGKRLGHVRMKQSSVWANTKLFVATKDFNFQSQTLGMHLVLPVRNFPSLISVWKTKNASCSSVFCCMVSRSSTSAVSNKLTNFPWKWLTMAWSCCCYFMEWNKFKMLPPNTSNHRVILILHELFCFILPSHSPVTPHYFSSWPCQNACIFVLKKTS